VLPTHDTPKLDNNLGVPGTDTPMRGNVAACVF